MWPPLQVQSQGASELPHSVTINSDIFSSPHSCRKSKSKPRKGLTMPSHGAGRWMQGGCGEGLAAGEAPSLEWWHWGWGYLVHTFHPA